MQVMTRGGRGHKAPYATKMVRVPVPLANQVHGLVHRYQEFLAQGGEPKAPPVFQEVVVNKPVDEFSDKLVDKFVRL